MLDAYTDHRAMSAPLPPELYYLGNFRTALAWVGERYADLLSAEESSFIARFAALPLPAQALLVRMVMRKGCHFRASKLQYAEIGATHAAAATLLELGWLSDRAPLEAREVAALLRKDELLAHLPLADRRASQKKAELEAQLAALELPAQPFAAWCPGLDERLYSLQVGALCDRLRLLFFGNLSQDWSEFVLTDLGIFRYEAVPISPESRGFRCRADVDDYLFLRERRERFEAGEPVESVLDGLLDFASANPYLQSRHARLLFKLAQQLEKDGAAEAALDLYRRCAHGEARWRQIRVLEKLERHAEAHALAVQASASPHNDEEAQRLERALPRLARKLGLPAPKRRTAVAETNSQLVLARPAHGSVEHAVREHLHRAEAPVHYVENTLLCSLFGLLCWEAIFAPLPGAFFHPFHSGPVDLYSSDFYARASRCSTPAWRAWTTAATGRTCASCIATSSAPSRPSCSGACSTRRCSNWRGLHPAAHLRACCERLLGDLRANRAGMPDLIQFHPAERRYRLIEVKGPGDRLQDNQKRWLAFAAAHGIPVEVCYVNWAAA